MLPCWAGAQDGNRAARAEVILVAPIEVAVARRGERERWTQEVSRLV